MPWSPTLHTSRLRSGQRAETAVAQREGKLCPGLGGPRRGGISAGKERESEPRLCPQAWAKGMSPTCADPSAIPSSTRRSRAWGRGSASSSPGECSFSPTLPSPLPRSRSEADRVRNAGPRQGRTEGREGRTATRPRPQRCFLRPGPARSGMPPTCQQARSSPLALPPPLSPPRLGPSGLCRGRRPRPLPAAGQLCRAQLPAGFCPHRRISRPASSRAA